MADTVPLTRASKVVADHKSRLVKSYQVLESELADISTMNVFMTASFSLGLSSASTAGGLWISMLIESNPSADATKFVPMLQIVLIVAAAILVAFGMIAWRSKSSVIDRIKQESGERGHGTLWNLWMLRRPKPPAPATQS